MAQITAIAVRIITEIIITKDQFTEYSHPQFICQDIAHHQDITAEDVAEDGRFVAYGSRLFEGRLPYL
jgi:hypothetical protein